MDFNDLSEDLKAKAKACKTPDELLQLAKDEGIAPDTIDAVSAVGVIDAYEFLKRAHALEDARENAPELFDDLATAYARAAHLADAALGDNVDEGILGPAERALLDACNAGAATVGDALSKGDFDAAAKALAGLREPIDRFFDDVMVMDEDTVVRENRLRLLNRFTGVFADVADIGRLSKK